MGAQNFNLFPYFLQNQEGVLILNFAFLDENISTTTKIFDNVLTA